MTSRVKVKVGTKGSVTLDPNDFIAAGGEASIYRKGDVVYKVYHSGRTGLNALEQKFDLLKKIKYPGIVSPQEPLYGTKDELVGYTMDAVDGEVLVRYFSNDFRTKNNFGVKETINCVYMMRDIVQAAHGAGAIIVDGNEMNYIVEQGAKACIIDVDSWQIGHYKATAIMPSIRDYHAVDFNQLTDWFSWAVVSFQLFVGIHPYKGRHPKYSVADFIERMKKNISVFDTAVLLPSTARDLNDVPSALLGWYEAVFKNGERSSPPTSFHSQQQQRIIQKTVYTGLSGGSGVKVSLTKLRSFTDKILEVFDNGCVLTQERFYTKLGRIGVETTKIFGPLPNKNFHTITTEHGTVLVQNGSTLISLLDGDNFEVLPTTLPSARFFYANNRLFSVTGGGITEIKILKLGANVIWSRGFTWTLNPMSTFFGEGAAIYDALGMPFIVLPYSISGCLLDKDTSYRKGKVLSLKGIANFVTCLVKDRSGNNFKIETLYPGPVDSWRTPKTWVGPTDETGLNFSMNHHGIVATIVEDGELVLFSPHSGQSKRVSDKNIKADMRLCTYNDNIAFIKDNEIWSISTS